MSHLPSLLLVFLGKDTFSDDKRMKGKETRISWSKGGFCQKNRKGERNWHWSLYEIEEILHKRIVHINGSVYVNNIYSLNGHLESVYVNNIYTLNGHLTRKSVYVNNIYTLNWHLTRKSVYAESPVHANF